MVKLTYVPSYTQTHKKFGNSWVQSHEKVSEGSHNMREYYTAHALHSVKDP